MSVVNLRRGIIGWALCAATFGCSLPSLSVTPRAVWLKVDGEAGASRFGTVETTDTDSLGLNEQPAFLAPRAELDWGAVHVFIDGLAASYDGTGTIEESLSIGGINIGVNAPVQTDFDLAFARGLVTFDFIPTDLVDVGIGLGVGIYDVDAQITDLTMMQTESVTEAFPIPLAAGRLATEIGPIQLSGILSGIHAPLQDLSVTLFDADVAASYEFASFTKLAGHIVLGYRHLGLDADFEDSGDDIELDLRFSGPYAGISISF